MGLWRDVEVIIMQTDFLSRIYDAYGCEGSFRENVYLKRDRELLKKILIDFGDRECPQGKYEKIRRDYKKFESSSLFQDIRRALGIKDCKIKQKGIHRLLDPFLPKLKF